MSNRDNTNNTDKKKNNIWQGISNLVFMYVPILIVIGCAIINQYPWSAGAKSVKMINFLSNTNNAVIIILISYIITVGKNHFDINGKIVKNIDNLRDNDLGSIKKNVEELRNKDVESIISTINNLNTPPTADQFLANRDEIESIDQILSEANTIKYSGGHLNSIILHQQLNDFLKRSDSYAYFIMPNPMDQQVVALYAEKLMVNTNYASLRMSIVNSILTLRALKTAGYNNFEYRFYDYLPSFGIQIIEQKQK